MAKWGKGRRACLGHFASRAAARGPHLWFTCAQRPSYRCGVNIRGWKCDILPAGRLEFIVGPGKRVEDWNIPLAELPDDLLPVGPRGGSPGCPHSTQQDGRWVFPLYVEDPGGYARKIIGNELAKLRHTRVGSRNHTLNAAAFKFAKLGEFVTVEQWRALVDTAHAIGLDPEEVHETIRSAMQAVQCRHSGNAFLSTTPVSNILNSPAFPRSSRPTASPP